MISISCLLSLIGVAQGAATADCSGSSCLPRSSLLQVKSSARKQSASLETHSSLKAQLAEYTKFTEDLVAKYAQDPVNATKEGSTGSQTDDESNAVDDAGKTDGGIADGTTGGRGGVTDEEREAVRVVLEFIQDMYLSLKSWHDSDVVLAASCTQESIVNECQLTDELFGQMNSRKSEVDTLAVDHEACRQEGVTACPAFPPQCPDYDNYRKNQGEYMGQANNAKTPSTPLYKLPDCVYLPRDDAGNLLPTAAFADDSIQTSDTTQLQTMEDCLRETKSWLDPLYTKYKDCERQEDDCQDKCPECKDKQSLFEEKHCEWISYLSTSCSGVQDCGNDATAECSTTCNSIQVRESARIADNETGQRLVCLLHVIFGEPKDVHAPNTEFYPRPSEEGRAAALALCKQKPYDTPDWNIQCNEGVWSSPAPCDHLKEPTCSEDFKDTWYIDRGLTQPCTEQCSCQDQANGKHVDECTLSDGAQCRA